MNELDLRIQLWEDVLKIAEEFPGRIQFGICGILNSVLGSNSVYFCFPLCTPQTIDQFPELLKVDPKTRFELDWWWPKTIKYDHIRIRAIKQIINNLKNEKSLSKPVSGS